ncbi:bifunctional metallophosphatase/5'-nucleotidase [Lacticaseibacillus brantae]|nr:bifunctional metallophosphatase/5'-nucleotidase [Lacticaseibacillus brantae]
MQLTILSTSDTHGFVAPTNYVQRQADLPFSLAKAKTVIDQVKSSTTDPVVVIENGDWLQGSPLAYYVAKVAQEPALLTAAYNAVGYDAGILGNHEFNYGTDYLAAAVKTLDYPMLTANIERQGQPLFGQPYTIVEKSGLKIAILGLTTDYIPHWETPSHIEGLAFVDVVEVAKHWVPILHELADIVVVAYHGGFEKDLTTGAPTERQTGENVGYRLANEVPGIDALVTGHQHRELAQLVNGVPVTQPGYRGANVGAITLDIEATPTGYQVSGGQAALLSTGNAIAAEAVLSPLAQLSAAVEDWLDQPLGQVRGDMRIHDPFQARVDEVPYIEFIQQVQMAATQTDISGTALFNNEGRGFGESITMRDVVTNYIYPNTLAVVGLTGTDLKAALEQNAEYFSLSAGQLVVTPRFETPKPQHYNYDMYEGIDYTLDISKPVGQRVTKLTYHDEPVVSDHVYEVVVNQYRAGGGGNFPMFDASKIVRENQKDMTELIADYLLAHPVIAATANHNFHVQA